MIGEGEPRARSTRLSFVLASLLTAVALLDVSLRLVPHELFAFNPLPELQTLAPPMGAFEENRRIFRENVPGDLASLSNRPPLDSPRFLHFETDPLGYRNAIWVAAPGAPTALLLGDSFAYAGQTADGTLAGALTRATGEIVFNGGGARADLAHASFLARQLAMRRGVVFYELLERHDIPADSVATAVSDQYPTRRLERWGLMPLLPLVRTVRLRWRVSPLAVAAQRTFNRIADDAVLPNPLLSQVVAARLRNGDDILFHPAEIWQHHQPVFHTVDYFARFGQQLQDVGLTLVVLLVPTKYLVYGQLLNSHVEALPPPDVTYLDQLEAALRGADIEVVNLQATLVAAAEAGLSGHEYVYYRDDTHWNERGMDLAAREIARQQCR